MDKSAGRMSGIPGPLIISSPYEEPSSHWSYDRETRTFSLIDGRRQRPEPSASSWVSG